MKPRPTTSRTFLASVAVSAVALLSACGGAAPAVVAPPGVQPTDCGTVRIASNPWVGYTANIAVVSYLMREELGCEVKIVEAGEAESWEQLAAGDVDVILENWGHDDLKKRYIDTERVAVEAGLTGNSGKLGWYVPPWMERQYPQITDWKFLKTHADLFETPASGGKGQLLDGDPTFVTNDKPLVQNLGLDFTVVYAGTEDKLIEAFRKAERDKTPLLGYFYSPQWLLSEIDLVPVALPEYTPGCDADPVKVACGYQPYALDKIANKEFATSGSPAAELVKRFSWTDADQNQVARDLTNKVAPDVAAKKWLDGHQETWRKWLPATTAPATTAAAG